MAAAQRRKTHAAAESYNTTSSDESSSDEEEKARLKEAVVGSFVDQDSKEMLQKRASSSSQKGKNSQDGLQRKSVRSMQWNDDFEDEVLQATPGFKKFVAKKLSKHLESLISEAESKDIPDRTKDNQTSPSTSSAGIKLFCSSPVTITADECKAGPKSCTKSSTKKPLLSDSSDSEEEYQRFAEAAISGSFIIANSGSTTVCVNDKVSDGVESEKSGYNKRKIDDKAFDEIRETGDIDKKIKKKRKKKLDVENKADIVNKKHLKKKKSKCKEKD